MINRYDRGAQTLGDLEYGPFPDITRAVPELPPRLATALAQHAEGPKAAAVESPVIPPTSFVGARGFEPPTPTVSSGLDDAEETQGAVITTPQSDVDPPSTPLAGPGATAWGNGRDAVEVALADAITKATTAGEWALVGQLARELETRRQARGSNVVSFDTRRRGGRS